jgi:predicted peptidase
MSMSPAIIPILAFVLIFIIACPASAIDNDTARGFVMKTIKVDGKALNYVVYVPRLYNPSKPMPTIIFLNGKGECGTDGLKQCFHFGNAIMLDSGKWPFLVLFPQKQDSESLWEDEEPMVMAIYRQAQKDYNIDKSRLYLTGLSQGGHGTWAIAARNPDLFAAIAPVCGWADKQIAEKVVKLPIWTFHGDQDQAVDVERSREMEKWISAAGGNCKLTIYPGVGHNSWDNAYRNEGLGDWFLQHKK